MTAGSRGAHRVEHPDDVDVDDPPECFRVHLQHGTEAGDTGVGHHDVDTAEPGDGRLGGALHRCQIPHIGQCREHVRLATEFVGQFGQRLRIEVGEHQLRALAAQPAGHLRPDTARTAGDDDHLAVQ